MGKPANAEAGQILLIVLVTSAILFTLVMSIATRSVTEVSTTTTEEESLRAFSAAEAGIEEVLVSSYNLGDVVTNTVGEELETGTAPAGYEATIDTFGETQQYNYPYEVFSGDVVPIWFVGHDINGNLTCGGGVNCFRGNHIDLCWGKDGTGSNGNDTPAVFVSIIYIPNPRQPTSRTNEVQIARAGYDPYATRASRDHFERLKSNERNSSCDIDGYPYQFDRRIQFNQLGIPSTSFNNAGGLQVMLVKILYNDTLSHTMGVMTSNPLPDQGIRIDSKGESGDSVRNVEVFVPYAVMPAIFDAALFSPLEISK